MKEQRRYWLKLEKHFFDSDNIAYLEAQENGDKYINIWIRLLLLCLKDTEENAGFLRFTQKIPYTDTLLAKILRKDIDVVRVAMKYFVDIGMVDVLEDGTIYIEEIQRIIGSEASSAERVRQHRKRKALQCNGNALLGNETELHRNTDDVTLSDNKEVEVEVEVEKEEEKKTKYAPHVKLTEDEYKKFIKKYGEKQTSRLIETLDAYKESKGKTYKSDAGAIRSWVVEKVKPVERAPVLNVCSICGENYDGGGTICPRCTEG